MRLQGALSLALSALALAPSAQATVKHTRSRLHDGNKHEARGAGAAYNPHHAHREIMKRATFTDPTSIANLTYDFIVVGGGVAGLVIASRLSEVVNQTVLVIEAGGDGSDVEINQEIPGYTYHHGISTGTPYGWNYTTVKQDSGSANNYYPLGRGLGGSGAINGMFWCRGDKAEYDAWGELNPGTNITWNWNEMDTHIKKAENLQMPPQYNIDTFSMPINQSAHGSGGNLQVGWSDFIYPAVANWVPTWVKLGLKAHDLADGTTRGVMITPSTLDNSQRSDSRTAYLDPVNTRGNLFVLTQHQATKIFFNGTKDASGNMIASGVQFQHDGSSPSYLVYVAKEIIVSSGTINSAKLLQLSGVGPSSVLSSLGINVVIDLPVGYNFQDHAAYNMVFNAADGTRNWFELKDEATAAAALSEYQSSKTGPWTYINEAVAYATQIDIAGSNESAASLANGFDIAGTVAKFTSKYNLPSNVQAGITAQLNIQKRWMTQDVGTIEYIMHMMGANNTISVQVCLQHANSRGTVMISSTDPFALPLIDPNYFGADIDATILAQASEFTRKMVSTDPMNSVLVSEKSPGADVTGDALVAFVKTAGWTEYHPMSTCSMLPKDKGGVVDTSLKVYGASNLRVADASIMPIHVSAHLMASTYGIAEKVSEIIKAAHAKPNVTVTSSSSSSSASASKTSSSSASHSASASVSGTLADKSEADSSVLSLGAQIGIGIGAAIVAIAIVGVLLFFCMNKTKKETQATDKNGWYDRGAANGQWAQHNAGSYQDSYPMDSNIRNRPLSQSGSIHTMGTNELPSRPSRSEETRFGMHNY